MKEEEINLLTEKLESEVNIVKYEKDSYEISVIETVEQAKNALSMALQSRKIFKALEEERKKITKPHVDFQRSINKLVGSIQDRLKEIETRLESKISTWVEQELENPFSQFDSIVVEDGSLLTKNVWDFCIINENEIPPEFLVPCSSLIELAIKNGIRKIPGVEIFQKRETSLRVKN